MKGLVLGILIIFLAGFGFVMAGKYKKCDDLVTKRLNEELSRKIFTNKDGVTNSIDAAGSIDVAIAKANDSLNSVLTPQNIKNELKVFIKILKDSKDSTSSSMVSCDVASECIDNISTQIDVVVAAIGKLSPDAVKGLKRSKDELAILKQNISDVKKEGAKCEEDEKKKEDDAAMNLMQEQMKIKKRIDDLRKPKSSCLDECAANLASYKMKLDMSKSKK